MSAPAYVATFAAGALLGAHLAHRDPKPENVSLVADVARAGVRVEELERRVLVHDERLDHVEHRADLLDVETGAQTR